MDMKGSLYLQIETTSTCNARCHFCVYKDNMDWRAGKLMTRELYHKIIDECSEIPHISTILFHSINEPLTDPRLEEFIAYHKQKMQPGIINNVFTNGTLLSPKRFDSLKAAGMDSLIVSLNAVRGEQHEAIMGLKDKFDKVCENIQYAIDNRGDMNIQVTTVSNGIEFTDDDARQFIKRWGWKQNNGYGLVVRQGNWADQIRTRKDNLPDFAEACHRALGNIHIIHDGTMTACCYEPIGDKMAFGNVNNESIRDIYNSPKYVQFREDHANDMADKYDICKGCTRI